MSLVTVNDLHVHFSLPGGQTLRAVDGVSFDIQSGETLGLVGESGCGKSTTARALLRLVSATSGAVSFDGRDVFALSDSEMRTVRKRMQIVFQDPYASLSPRLSIGAIIGEPLEVHGVYKTPREKQDRVAQLLSAVGMNPAVATRFPHEFSGGQRQRIGIARALALNPSFVVLDEPVSALDISVRAQVVNLLMDLQNERGIGYLFVGHDLSLIRHVAHRVAVMYLGRIVEIAEAHELYTNPRHPYTRSLFAAAPNPKVTGRRKHAPIEGDPPSPVNLPKGCRFQTRCPYAQEICTQVDPPYVEITNPASPHRSACHFAHELPMWVPL